MSRRHEQGHVFNIPPGQPFLQSLIDGLTRYNETELSSAFILLPTRRACTALRDHFMAGGQAARLLPTIRQLSVVDEDELLITATPELAKAVLDLPPAITPMRRKLLLTRLMMARKDIMLSHAQAFQLAGDLGHLIDQMLIENCDPEKLPMLVEDGRLADHWTKIVEFLSIITHEWPAILAEQGFIEAMDRRKRLMALYMQYWRQYPPAFPIIAAGSTGSHPTTADFLRVISQLPKGAVILPGLDQHLDEKSWEDIGPSHPQYLLKRLIKKLDVERDHIPAWGKETLSPRAVLLSEVMRPAEQSDQWEAVKETLQHDHACQGLEMLTAEHEQEEALLAALMLREKLEDAGKTAALITPDRALAARVAAHLRRWNILVDDSAGTPLSQTLLASYIMLLLQLPRGDLKPSDLMAFLKHPYTSLGLGRETCLQEARQLEKDFFRTQICGQGIATWATLYPSSALLQQLAKSFAPMGDLYAEKPLAEWLDAHVGLAQTFCKSDLWQGPQGEALSTFLDALRVNSADYICSFHDYAGIFTQGLQQATVRQSYGQHPRIHIFGLIEARMLSFDHIILAGLNEDTWPEMPKDDPWMSPFMRVQFGLPSPDQHIGQTAHDFVQLAAQPNVTLLRCARDGVTPTNPSRWLLRLQAVLKLLNKENALTPQKPWHDWAKTLIRPAEISPLSAPEVQIATADLPQQLSASDIELWIRDPYAFYAKKVLRLRPLDALDAELTALERGNIIHGALDKLSKTYPDSWPREAQQTFMDALKDGFLAHGVTLDAWHAMLPRLSILGKKLWEEEGALREGLSTFQTEIKGEMRVNVPGYAPILHARADRINVTHDGTLEIIDYKTGAVPTKHEIDHALKPQLLIEAIIAAQGGYKDMPAADKIDTAYIRVTESEDLFKAKNKKSFESSAIKSDHLDGLISFVNAFVQKEARFLSVPRPALLDPSPDYARLARIAEWSKGELSQEDGE